MYTDWGGARPAKCVPHRILTRSLSRDAAVGSPLPPVRLLAVKEARLLSLRRSLERIGPVYRFARGARRMLNRTIRVRQLKEALRFTFRDHLDRRGVIEDYRFSLRVTDRQCCQVLLLEDTITMLARGEVAGALVECGVYTGGASAYLLRSALRHFASSDLPDYWGFDSFQGMPHATSADGDAAVTWLVGLDDQGRPSVPTDGKLEGTTVNRADLASVSAYLQDSQYPPHKLHLVPGWFQDTLSGSKAQIGAIALLRLDGDFYESTRTCLEQLGDAVAPNGAIIFDDYGAFAGCRKAVDEYLATHRDFSRPFRYDAHQAFVLRSS